MTETKDPGEKLGVPQQQKTLTLKARPTDQNNVVRQSFSHGRSKAVVVEKVPTRRFTGPGSAPAAAPAPAAPVVARPATPGPAPTPRPTPSGPGAARPDAPRPDAARQQEALRAEAARQEALRAEAARQEAARTEAARQEAARTEAARAEAARAEAARQEAARSEAARAPAAVPETTRPTAPAAPVAEAAAPAAPPAAPVAAAPAAPAPVAAAPARPAPEPARPAAAAPVVRPAGEVRPAASAAAGSPGRSAPPAGRDDRRGPPPGARDDRRGPVQGRDDRRDDRRGPPAGGRDDRRGPPPRDDRRGPPQNRPGGGMVLKSLSDAERETRMKALAEFHVREVEDRRRAEEEARLRAEREAREAVERAAAEARKREEEERHRREEDTRRRAEQEAAKRFGGQQPAAAEEPRAPRGPRPAPGAAAAPAAPAAPLGLRPAARGSAALEEEDERRGSPRRPGGAGPGGAAKVAPPAKTPRATPGADDKRRGKLTLVTALDEGEERTRSVAAFKRRVQRMTGQRQQDQKEKVFREVIIPEAISIADLANRMSERAVDVIRLLMKQGQMMKINDVIDADTAQLVAEEMGHTVKRVSAADVEEGLFDAPDEAGMLLPRPPVVTIMGHVDHGKTSLLDAIRTTNVVSGEAGGITQHIGAYQVTSPLGGKITFIDTPGHAAFTQMRARGARVTDIVVLVVAADDGVMPQTIEAIQHAKAAKVPMIVAINKIDKADAKPERVRTELLQYEVQVEEMGGEVLDVEVSAKQKLNLDKLLETIQLQSEVLELKAATDRAAEGTVVEAKLDRGRGPVATVLVQRGTLKPGDIVVAGSEWGRVRALLSDSGQNVAEAGPSMPVEVLGFNATPEAGDRLAVVESEARAREITDYRTRQKREKLQAKSAGLRGSLAEMMNQLKSGAGAKEFPLLVKADVQGSVEAIVGALEKLGNDEVRARVLLSGVGGIAESDITLASASGAAVIGFNVRAHKEAREAADRTGTEIRYYNIIYDLVDDVKQAMSGLLAPIKREVFLGNAEILEIFAVSKVGKIAGCRVTEGVVQKGAGVRLIRDNVVIHEGKLSTLKRFKDDASEVLAGQECGMSFEGYQDMRAGDVIECYRVEIVQRSL